MNDRRNRGGAARSLATALMLASAGRAWAQAAPVPQETPRTIPGLAVPAPTPEANVTPVPVPTAPVRGLPAPAAGAAPTDTPSPPRIARAARTPRGEVPGAPTAMSTPRATRTVAPATTPPASPDPQAGPSASPTPRAAADVATATAAATPAANGDRGAWPWAIGGVLLSAAAAALWLRRRADVPEDASPVAVDRPPAPSEPAAVARPQARIAIAFQPTRAGLNMLSATVEGDVVVINRGDAPADGVRVQVTLLSAHGGQEAELAAVFAAPTGRPAAPPFALGPGDERRVRVVAALPREAVRSIEAAGRPIFVPLIVVDVRYVADAAGRAARAGQAFVVGIERVDSARLAPFWLDGPLKMHDRIAARAQGAAVE